MSKLTELRIYNLANEISDKIWDETVAWQYFSKDTIGKQMVRSADSISANIAEGYGRFHYKENKLFCYYSRGSLLETFDWISKSKRRGLISLEKADEIIKQLELMHHLLNAYIKSIGPSKNE